MKQTPRGLEIPDRATIAEVLGRTAPELAVRTEDLPGTRFHDARLASGFFVNSPGYGASDHHDAFVLIANQAVMGAPLIKYADHANAMTRSLVVVAPAFDESALGLLLVNTFRGDLYACALVAEGATLEAIAKLVGTEVVSSPEDTDLDALKRARRVVGTRIGTIIVP